MSIQDQVRDLISKNKLAKALELLNTVSSIAKEVTLHTSALSELTSNASIGIISGSELRTELAKINYAVLNLCDKIGDSTSSNHKEPDVVLVISQSFTSESEVNEYINKQPLKTIFAHVLSSQLPNQLKDAIEDMERTYTRAERDGGNNPTVIADTKTTLIAKFQAHFNAKNAKKGEQEKKLMTTLTEKVNAITNNWDQVGPSIVYFLLVNNQLQLGLDRQLKDVKYLPTLGAVDDTLLAEMRSEGLIDIDTINEAKATLNRYIGETWTKLENRGIRRS